MADWQVVRTVGTEEEAELIAGYLEAAGIEVEVESLLFHQEPVTFGRLGEVRVLVDAGALAAAEAALASDEESKSEAALDAAESETALDAAESDTALDAAESDGNSADGAVSKESPEAR